MDGSIRFREINKSDDSGVPFSTALYTPSAGSGCLKPHLGAGLLTDRNLRSVPTPEPTADTERLVSHFKPLLSEKQSELKSKLQFILALRVFFATWTSVQNRPIMLHSVGK